VAITDFVAPLYELGRIGDGAALAVAILLGAAFGWFLERGGLGSARKLAGQFYLADFTVFKVMFSAIVTAMLGLFWLGQLGVVDVARVYVPETDLLPQLVGGLVFGAGFVIGGLCPGTSCVAAATGRLDGLAVVAGMLGGIWVFSEAFPVLEPFYMSTPRGTLTLPALLGVPHGVAVFAVVAIALVAFIGAERLRAPGDSSERASRMAKHFRTHRRLAVLAGALGTLALAAGEPYPARRNAAGDAGYVTAIDVARWLRDPRPGLRLVDVRADSAFTAYHIPGAKHIPLAELPRREWPRDAVVVVYADDDASAGEGARLIRGVHTVRVLRSGLLAWIDQIVEPRLVPLPPTATLAEQTARREQLELSRYFGGTPIVSPSAAPSSLRPLSPTRSPLAAGAPRAPARRPQSEAAAVARVIRRGC
jgi:rhodanese-related sulfurtransferase